MLITNDLDEGILPRRSDHSAERRAERDARASMQRGHAAAARSQGDESRSAVQSDSPRGHRLSARLARTQQRRPSRRSWCCRTSSRKILSAPRTVAELRRRPGPPQRNQTRNRGDLNVMSDYVELSNLTKIYPTPKGPAVIVKDFNLQIKQGRIRLPDRPFRLRQIAPCSRCSPG